MKIKSKIYILFAIFLVALFVTGNFLYLTSVEMNNEVKINTDFNIIMKNIFEINILTNDYLLNKQERVIDQWNSKYGSLDEFLLDEVEEEYHSKEETFVFGELLKDHKELGDIFSRITKSEEGTELEARLVGQLLIKSQEMVSIALQLSTDANEKVLHAQQRNIFLNIIFFGLILFVVSLGVYIIISATRKINKISKIIDRISKGEIDVSIDKVLKKGNDEITSLVNSLERILASLKLAILRMDLSKGELGLGEDGKKKVKGGKVEKSSSGEEVVNAVDEGGEEEEPKEIGEKESEEIGEENLGETEIEDEVKTKEKIVSKKPAVVKKRTSIQKSKKIKKPSSKKKVKKK
ncbi:hypothetical protein HOD29_03340 [archaeon]|jgi:methyl-accepting chemotaxis protein|nr:hypothetical protein [archaeon]